MTVGSNSAKASSKLPLGQRLSLAGISLVLGATVGVFIRRSGTSVSTSLADEGARHSANSPAGGWEVAINQLKNMADKQAEPLLAQLQSTPNDPELLARLGNIYFATRGFNEASNYYRRSVDIRDDVIVRTELGRAYYYAGNPDSALAEFEQVLKVDPDNANALFNVGMIKWHSRFDVDGAIAAWQQLLKKNPGHARRADVEKLTARARQHRAVLERVKSD